jgi:RNA polymerase sigma factor (sigma-70 family)
LDAHHDRRLLHAAAPGDGGAFGEFYQRHVRSPLAFFLHRTGSAEIATDLAHETWVPALEAVARYRGDGSPAAWLYGIARHKLALSSRRGRVEASTRERLAQEPLVVIGEDVETIENLADVLPVATPALDLLERLPEPQREAIRARMLDELEYPEIARRLECSEAVARQRVSRGLRSLRTDSECEELGR